MKWFVLVGMFIFVISHCNLGIGQTQHIFLSRKMLLQLKMWLIIERNYLIKIKEYENKVKSMEEKLSEI